MVAVIVREQAKIDRRQSFDVERRFGQPLGREPVTQMNVIAGVQEIRVGQDGETAETQDDGGGTDKQYRT